MKIYRFIFLALMGLLAYWMKDVWLLWVPLLVSIIINQLIQLQGSIPRFVRKWHYRLELKRVLVHVAEKKAPTLVKLPMLVYLQWDGEKDYINMPYNQFINHVAEIPVQIADNILNVSQENRSANPQDMFQHVMDIVAAEEAEEEERRAQWDASLENPDNWDSKGNFKGNF